MHYIVFDLESTCWKKRTWPEQMEVIEIGAVKLGEHFTEVSTFDKFVKPIENPTLSEFCSELTHIRQSDIDAAGAFPAVFAEFLDWVGPPPCKVISWGDYDILQLTADCRRHGISLPGLFTENHINIKHVFAERYNRRPCGMSKALRILKLPLVGVHHRGGDDARNIGAIARVVLARQESP